VTAPGRRIETLFVANRGEIARRIATTARRLGIHPVVPSLDGSDAVDLLDARSVVAAAVAAGADAVHPGYGFLAEDPVLARSVIDAGLTWVGPPPEAIRALGDKAEARGIARRVGVPVAEGEEPSDQSDASLTAAAERIGYPVLVKPVAGGGGKGIRVVVSPADLPAALAAARREASRAFADDRLLLERYVVDARHVEVQVLADRHGTVVHLGDRDCSLQRRHQKVLEEAPAPGLDDGVRRALWAAAVRLAGEVGFENAGTCEFLVGGDGGWIFLELNARLQVEHPVTELVLGRDLVADQLGIAAGATLAELGIDQAAIESAFASGGHAIEARLNAEDPANGFLPSAGHVALFRLPADAAAFGPLDGAAVRVDAGVATGDVVTGRFDPLLAKVIAHGPDRDAALERLGDALGQTEILGLPTNLAFLRRLARVPLVVAGHARTTTVDADPDVVAAATAAAVLTDAHWMAAGRRLAATGARGAFGGGWRLNAPGRRYRLVADTGDRIERRTIAVPQPAAGEESVLDVAGPVGDTVHVGVEGRSVAVRLEPPPDLAAAEARAASGGTDAGDAELRAPMPGLVVGVHVRAGDAVKAGDRVATLEAMKMEHVVAAPRDARVEEVGVREGEQVERGRVVARLRAAS
jgi:acetyl-CoA/propionyl-CoA carboxylase biotin carboxyl carrier protein